MDNKILELLKQIEYKLDRIDAKIDIIDNKTECIYANLERFNSRNEINIINNINKKIDCVYRNKIEKMK